MRLRCLGSGSSGNCYLLENDAECLVIEQGIPMKEVKIALDFNISKIVGGIQSHSHKDHSAYAGEFEKCGIEIWRPNESGYKTRKFGGFKIQAFPLVHDVPCYGFVIWHQDCGPIVFATDTEYIPVTFRGIKPETLMVECSYQTEYLPEGSIKNDRQYLTHMECETTRRCVLANQTPSLRHVVLLHLSFAACNDKEVTEAVKNDLNGTVGVYTACKGMSIEL